MSSSAFENYASNIASARPLNPQEEKHLKAQRRYNFQIIDSLIGLFQIENQHKLVGEERKHISKN